MSGAGVQSDMYMYTYSIYSRTCTCEHFPVQVQLTYRPIVCDTIAPHL